MIYIYIYIHIFWKAHEDELLKWAAFMWFVRNSALAGTAVIHCSNTLNNCSTSITNQPQAPISQSVLPVMSTKTYQDIPDLTLDKLYIGYNWLVGPLWICVSPMALKINGSKRRNRMFRFSYPQICLTHWGRVTHICVSKLGHHWLR